MRLRCGFFLYLLCAVFVSLFFDGVIAARTASCPRTCPHGSYEEPACGSDGIIYYNECELRRKTCGKGVTKDTGPNACTAETNNSTCNHRCSDERDPVCGTDGRTYLNRCMLHVEKCRTNVSLSHFGPCNNISAHRENCPVNCDLAPMDGPICGSDGNVYKNTCQMKLLTCGQGVVKTSKKYCQTTRYCSEPCWRNSKPTCGSDGNIYSNACRMKAKNCGKHIYEVPMAYCMSQREREGAASMCPVSCDEEPEQLICGSDGNIYKNECEMKMLNCGLKSKSKTTKVGFDNCSAKYERCSKINCTNEEDYICGTDSNTYNNLCHLQIAGCMRGVQIAHTGRCISLTLNEPCPTHCDDDEQQPTCGSDGNVYRSHCDMLLNTCGQKVVAVPLHHCRKTSSCNEECPKEKNYVCGSDNNLYRNECEMRRNNCGKHIFIAPMKKCLSSFSYRRCRRSCPNVYEPVCGSNNKTYENECLLETENCKKRSLVFKKYYGTCEKPVLEPQNYLY